MPDNQDEQAAQAPAAQEAAAPTATPTVIKAKPVKSTRKVKDGLEEAIVKRGTLVVGDNEEAKPGDTVRLPVDEVAALRKAGVLVDPEEDAITEQLAANMVAA